MTAEKDQYLEGLMKERKNVFDTKLADFNAHLGQERAKRLEQRKEDRIEERRRQWMQDKREEEQQRRDELAKRGKEEKLPRWSEDVRRTRRIGQSSRRLKRRSGRRRPRSSAGCRSSVRRSERRPEVIEEAEIVPSLAAGAVHVETMVQDVETMDPGGEMMDQGGEMMDPGEMGLSDQGLVAPLGTLAAADGETGSKGRM